MTEVIDNTIASLNDLTNKTIQSGVEFRGFAKSITEAASSFEGAGQKWTVFSRLVSGTPIWAMQNKARAWLAIIGGFEKRSKANSKAMTVQNKKFVDQMQGIKKVNKEYGQLSESMDAFMESGATSMAQFNEALERNGEATLEALENTLEYQTVIAAGGTDMMAAATAMATLSKRKEELEKKDKRLIQTAKEAYAFDTKRIKIAQDLAYETARLEGETEGVSKLIGQDAGTDERTKMTNEQEGLVTSAVKDRKNSAGFGKDFKKTFAPVLKYIPLVAKQGTRKERNQERILKLQLKGEKIGAKVKPILGMAFKYLVFGILGFIAFGILAAFLYNAWKQFETMGIMDTIKEFASAFMNIITLIVETFMAFTSGGVDEGLAKLQELGWAIADFVWIGLKLVVKIAGALVLGIYETAKAFFHKFWNDADFAGNVLLGIAAISAFILGAWAVKYYLGIALTLAGVYALPIMIGVVLGLVILAGLKWLWDKLSDWNLLAAGGTVTTGMQIVGEKGPELVSLPKGSRVHSNKDSRKMASSGGNTINITINARDTSDAELRRIADQIGSMVNNKINRSTSSGTMV